MIKSTPYLVIPFLILVACSSSNNQQSAKTRDDWSKIGVNVGLTEEQISDLRKELAKKSILRDEPGKFEDAALYMLSKGVDMKLLADDFNGNLDNVSDKIADLAEMATSLHIITKGSIEDTSKVVYDYYVIFDKNTKMMHELFNYAFSLKGHGIEIQQEDVLALLQDNEEPFKQINEKLKGMPDSTAKTTKAIQSLLYIGSVLKRSDISLKDLGLSKFVTGTAQQQAELMTNLQGTLDYMQQFPAGMEAMKPALKNMGLTDVTQVFNELNRELQAGEYDTFFLNMVGILRAIAITRNNLSK